MAGRPIVPDKIHKRIRKLAAAGETQASIRRLVGCSRYTVLAALDPAWRAREAERQRTTYPGRHMARRDNPSYVTYRTGYFDTDDYRAAARDRMRRLRVKGTRSQ